MRVALSLLIAAQIKRVTGVLLVASSLATMVANGQSFDKPVHKTVLDLGRSEYLMPNDDRHVTVTCWYFAHFIVKQKNDPGMKGAELIASAPIQRGNPPRCTISPVPNERPFREWSEESKVFVTWDGYFAGVKRDLIFLGGSDGDENSGLPFTVFKSDGQTRIFSDSATLLDRGRRELSFPAAHGNQIKIRYIRVASASCSIPNSGEACWDKLKQKTNLSRYSMPRCSDYKGEQAGKAPSVIAYPVEVTLFPKPSIRPLGGPIRCYRME